MSEFDPLETAEAVAASTPSALHEEIEELVAEYGLRFFVQAVLRSSASDAIAKMGAGGRMDAISWVLGTIISSKSARMQTECMAFGAGLLGHDATTMTAIAKRYGTTKANVSRIVLEFNDRLDLEPHLGMKSTAVRQNHKLTNRAREKSKPTKDKQ